MALLEDWEARAREKGNPQQLWTWNFQYMGWNRNWMGWTNWLLAKKDLIRFGRKKTYNYVNI